MHYKDFFKWEKYHLTMITIGYARGSNSNEWNFYDQSCIWIKKIIYRLISVWVTVILIIYTVLRSFASEHYRADGIVKAIRI